MTTRTIYWLTATFLTIIVFSSCKENTNESPTPETGMAAPDFTLESSTGENITLSSLKGNIVILDFWASWCSFCKAENPQVKTFYNQYHPQGLEIIGVSIDEDRTAWESAIEEQQLPYLHVIDTQAWKSETVKNYGVGSIPHFVLIDKNGDVVATADQIGLLEIKMLALLNAED